eukprot:gnl/TRDRNA2_/TRDRNA2_116395_c0_seq1.p2 gnl/TRDRNA2_/TRDRNA2_116395_c0~~gnl/TRDRNA2_/TRDRNA2_116395_c0_seq1.p2  ORF type:complete len:118 (+),score=23.24 gnl/TRDRNA2_/TRDRNA2_116395_c0_seq1:95-448(+)
MKLRDDKLLNALAREAEIMSASELCGQALAMTAWAFATVKQPHARMFAALVAATEQQLNQLETHSLASTAWAFAKIQQSDEKIFTALARVAERRITGFNLQQLTMTLSALLSCNAQL